jgi:adenylate cyclase
VSRSAICGSRLPTPVPHTSAPPRGAAIHSTSACGKLTRRLEPSGRGHERAPQIAAILAADVAGYSRLTGIDEEGTLKRLRKLRRELINPAVSLHRGRIVKTTGDGILIEFPSVVDALRCALDVQRGMDGRNADVAADQRIEFRVGINLGDVVVEGGDLLGDGVNVAARLEGIADPGGICISDDAYRQVQGKVQAEVVDIGEQQLKNITRSVRAYRVVLDSETARKAGAALPLPNKPVIAVLPFTNLSRDPDQDYFSDGLTEDIITALSRWRSFPVISRNSTFTYKGHAVPSQQIARELGARYIIEGSVRRSGERIRVAAQLIEGATGHHVWADAFDRPIADFFEIQDQITSRISAVIAPELELFELRKSAGERPKDLGAWELYVQGLRYFYQETAEGMSARGSCSSAPLSGIPATVRRGRGWAGPTRMTL